MRLCAIEMMGTSYSEVAVVVVAVAVAAEIVVAAEIDVLVAEIDVAEIVAGRAVLCGCALAGGVDGADGFVPEKCCGEGVSSREGWTSESHAGDALLVTTQN